MFKPALLDNIYIVAHVTGELSYFKTANYHLYRAAEISRPSNFDAFYIFTIKFSKSPTRNFQIKPFG
jgi:hypothetical protein